MPNKYFQEDPDLIHLHHSNQTLNKTIVLFLVLCNSWLTSSYLDPSDSVSSKDLEFFKRRRRPCKLDECCCKPRRKEPVFLEFWTGKHFERSGVLTESQHDWCLILKNLKTMTVLNFNFPEDHLQTRWFYFWAYILLCHSQNLLLKTSLYKAQPPGQTHSSQNRTHRQCLLFAEHVGNPRSGVSGKWPWTNTASEPAGVCSLLSGRGLGFNTTLGVVCTNVLELVHVLPAAPEAARGWTKPLPLRGFPETL